MKRVPIHTPSAPSASDGGQAPPVEQPAGRDHRHPIADGVDDLGHERHGGDLAGVAAGLGALGHDDVASGLDRGDGVADLAAHVHHQHVLAVAQLDDVAGHAQPGHEHPAAALDDGLDLRLHVARSGGEQVDAEGLVGQRPHLGDLFDHLVEAHGRRAHAPEASGLADRRDQGRVRHPAHAGEHHGVLDLEDVGQSGAHDRDRRTPSAPTPELVAIGATRGLQIATSSGWSGCSGRTSGRVIGR